MTIGQGVILAVMTVVLVIALVILGLVTVRLFSIDPTFAKIVVGFMLFVFGGISIGLILHLKGI